MLQLHNWISSTKWCTFVHCLTPWKHSQICSRQRARMAYHVVQHDDESSRIRKKFISNLLIYHCLLPTGIVFDPDFWDLLPKPPRPLDRKFPPDPETWFITSKNYASIVNEMKRPQIDSTPKRNECKWFLNSVNLFQRTRKYKKGITHPLLPINVSAKFGCERLFLAEWKC